MARNIILGLGEERERRLAEMNLVLRTAIPLSEARKLRLRPVTAPQNALAWEAVLWCQKACDEIQRLNPPRGAVLVRVSETVLEVWALPVPKILPIELQPEKMPIR